MRVIKEVNKGGLGFCLCELRDGYVVFVEKETSESYDIPRIDIWKKIKKNSQTRKGKWNYYNNILLNVKELDKIIEEVTSE